MSSMSELKKRKKSLNQIVNPSISTKQISLPQNVPTHQTGFHPVSVKIKLKKATIGNSNTSPHSLYINPNTLKPDIPKSHSRKSMVKNAICLVFSNNFIFLESKRIRP